MILAIIRFDDTTVSKPSRSSSCDRRDSTRVTEEGAASGGLIEEAFWPHQSLET